MFKDSELTDLRTKTLIAQLVFEQQMASTNDAAIDLVRDNQLQGTPCLVLTNHQTAGRGQGSRRWASDANSLTFSVILPNQNTVGLPIRVGLAVCQAIEAAASLPTNTLQLKWPNDVLYGNQKLAGILIETAAAGATSFQIIGIGINANNDPSVAQPDDLVNALSPTSIKAIAGHEVCAKDVLVAVIERLTELPPLDELQTPAGKRLAYAGMPVELSQANGEVVPGTLRGIADDGQVVLRVDDRLQHFASGSLRKR